MELGNRKSLRDILDSTLDRIGPVFKQIVYKELQREGLNLDHPHPSLRTLEKVFEDIFGLDGTSLLMNVIKREVERH